MIIVVGMSAAAVLLVVRLRTALLASLDDAVIAQVHTAAAEAAAGPLSQPLPNSAEGTAAVQVIGAGGRVLTSSQNIDGDGRLFTFPGHRGRPALDTVARVPIGENQPTYRAAALKLSTRSGTVTVYAGLPSTDVTQSVTQLIGALVVGVPVVIGLLAVVGWVLLGRALRPVEVMRRQATAIPGTDLHRRLDPPPADDELGRLAATFNELLARIQTATDRQRQFAADAAHELRSPLAALRTQLEVATRDPTKTVAEAIDPALFDDTDRLSRLVDDLLQLARLDTQPATQRRPVDLDDLLLDEASRARSSSPRRIDAAGISAGRVLGDTQALRRVVRNLVDNALRHARNSVTLRLTSDGSTVTLTVADDGYGIPAGERDRVFERFVRLDDARSRDAGGAGLGLALVRDVVTAHDGAVRIDDNHPGARLTITLPAAQD